MSSPEKLSTTNPEQEHHKADLENAGMERREALREQHEKAGEQSHEKANEARQEALEQAHSAEKQEAPKHEQQPSPAEHRGGRPIGKAERDTSFDTTMQEIRTHMSPTSQAFSKVIHNKAIEKVSDVASNTVARPNAILAGSVFAFILTLAVYLIAKNLGYTLSGFETIGAFIAGWALGIAYDFLKVMITGRSD
jgi:cobalamin biosynthesis Mg chelatase CobN